MHTNRFSSNVVHRHIILLLLLDDYQSAFSCEMMMSVLQEVEKNFTSLYFQVEDQFSIPNFRLNVYTVYLF